MRNEDFRDMVGDASIVDKTRKCDEEKCRSPVRRCGRLDVVGS